MTTLQRKRLLACRDRHGRRKNQANAEATEKGNKIVTAIRNHDEKRKEIRNKLREHEEEQRAIAAKDKSCNTETTTPNFQNLLNFIQKQIMAHQGNLNAEGVEIRQQTPTRKVEDQN